MAKPPLDRRSDLATARNRLGKAVGGRVSSKVRPRVASGASRQARGMGGKARPMVANDASG